MAALCASVGLAACGGGASSTPSPAPTSGSTATGPAPVKEGGILRIGTGNYIDSFNPWNWIESQSGMAMYEIYPALVQYDHEFKFVPDWAQTWETSTDGLTWTFHLQSGGQWSDGKPLTADDAAWTINTSVKYKDDATANAAVNVGHVVNATAPDANTLVITYDKPSATVLGGLGEMPILPRHVWEPLDTDGKGSGLKKYRPELHMPMVTAGAFTIAKYEKKGTTVFKADPNFYGPKAHAAAVALTYYTNNDAMIADLKGGNLDYLDQVPFKAVKAVSAMPNVTVDKADGAEFTDITWNSNPKKKKHRELLDPALKKALAMGIDRQRIIDVVFEGNASLVDSVVGHIAGYYENKNLIPPKFDIAAGNAALDGLGYARGADGIRVVPASATEAAHPMAYDVMIPTSLDYDGPRTFQIIKDGWAQMGVTVTEVSGGDSTAAYAYETGDNCDATKGTGYEKFDIALWDWVPYPDPDQQLSYMTKAQWCSWNDTGYDNPAYDALYDQQSTTVDRAARKVIVDQMQQMLFDEQIYTVIANEVALSAHSNAWVGIDQKVDAYSKTFLAAPHQA
jgi:peptide/nickel transport system substrate-binding protein